MIKESDVYIVIGVFVGIMFVVMFFIGLTEQLDFDSKLRSNFKDLDENFKVDTAVISIQSDSIRELGKIIPGFLCEFVPKNGNAFK